MFTIQLFASSSYGMLGFCLMVAVSVLYECGKCALLFQALCGNFSSFGKAIMYSMWAFLTLASIFASAGYVLNQSNATKNEAVLESAAYRQQQDNPKLLQDLYNQKKTEIQSLKELQGHQIAEGQKIKESMPRNYIDRRQQQQASIDQRAAQVQEQINAKSSELSQVAAKLQAPSEQIKAEVLDTSGYHTMFQLIADSLNKSKAAKDDPFRAENLELWFYILIGVGFEALANTFAYLSQYYSRGSIAPSKPVINRPVGFKTQPQVITAAAANMGHDDGVVGSCIDQKPMRVIGFRSPAPSSGRASPTPAAVTVQPEVRGSQTPSEVHANFDIKKDDVLAYLRFMYDNAKDNISPRFRLIARNISVHEEICRKIKGHLERLGIIQSVGAKTIILCTESEAVHKI